MKLTPIKMEILGIILVGLSSFIAMSFSSFLKDFKNDIVLYKINENIGQIHCMTKDIHGSADRTKGVPNFPISNCNRAAMNPYLWTDIESDLKRLSNQDWYASLAVYSLFIVGTGLFVAAKISESKGKS
ncbi:MAG: hypothetical protein ABL930_00410 [Pseudobdellovibrio sp.]